MHTRHLDELRNVSFSYKRLGYHVSGFLNLTNDLKISNLKFEI